MSTPTIFLVVMTVAGVFVWQVYNRLMALDSRCEQAVADIDVQLKQRYALLPNLLEMVEGFAKHESEAIDIVTPARAATLRAALPQARRLAETTLGAGMQQLLTIAEAYPELQASHRFRELRMEIADAENKIAAARRYLNATVNEYNATLRQFPANILAGRLRLSRRPFYDIGVERVLLDDAPSTSRRRLHGARRRRLVFQPTATSRGLRRFAPCQRAKLRCVAVAGMITCSGSGLTGTRWRRAR